jgi:hypothetical protein
MTKNEAIELAILALWRYQRDVAVIAGINEQSAPHIERIEKAVAILEGLKDD